MKFIVCLGFSLCVGWILSVHVASVHAMLPFEANKGIGLTWLPVCFVVALLLSLKVTHGK
jgi:hypothetical protein